MPIEIREGDLFAQKDINVILHQANTCGTLKRRCSSGFASKVEKLFPKAADADIEPYDNSKIGSYSFGNDEKGRTCFNCYSQFGPLPRRDTSYDAVFEIFTEIERICREFNETYQGSEDRPQKVVGIPARYGSNLAHGNWGVIKAIIKAVFEESPVKCVIVDFGQ